MSTPVSDGASPSDSTRQSLVELSPASASASDEKPPSQPLVVVEPTPGWSSINLREIWRYRELLYFLAWRDVKVRYKQTLFGIGWVIMQPLLSTLIFTFVLGKLARVPSDGLPYPVFVYAGLLPWIFFSSSIISSGNSLVGSAHLITKVYFPRLIVPMASVAARIFDLAVSFVILIGMMLYYRLPLTRGLVMLPVIMVIVALLALAVGVWFSAINVRYRDVAVLLPVLTQAWMFASPIVYPSSLVHASSGSAIVRQVYGLNPLVGIVDNFRAAIFGGPFNWAALGLAAAITIVLLVYSAYDFRRMERNFADVI